MFHRVIPGFMAQGGDPQGTGQGGSPLPDLAAEFNDLPHLRGVASMARADAPNSANSQFFIVLAPTFKLDQQIYRLRPGDRRHGGGRRHRGRRAAGRADHDRPRDASADRSPRAPAGGAGRAAAAGAAPVQP